MNSISWPTCRTLTNNNITTVWRGTFETTPRLRALRISGNKLICDCHLAWLGRMLAAAPHLAPYVRCSSPYRLKDRLVTEVLDQEFKCTGKCQIPVRLLDTPLF